MTEWYGECCPLSTSFAVFRGFVQRHQQNEKWPRWFTVATFEMAYRRTMSEAEAASEFRLIHLEPLTKRFDLFWRHEGIVRKAVATRQQRPKRYARRFFAPRRNASDASRAQWAAAARSSSVFGGGPEPKPTPPLEIMRNGSPVTGHTTVSHAGVQSNSRSGVAIGVSPSGPACTTRSLRRSARAPSAGRAPGTRCHSPSHRAHLGCHPCESAPR
jgi:hypothetical protein